MDLNDANVSVLQLLQSIDERLKNQTDQFKGLTESVEECKQRLVDLEDICAPLKTELVDRRGPVLRMADQSVQVSENRSMTSLSPITPKISSSTSPVRSVSTIIADSSTSDLLSSSTSPSVQNAGSGSTTPFKAPRVTMIPLTPPKGLELALASKKQSTPRKVRSPVRGSSRRSTGSGSASSTSRLPCSGSGSPQTASDVGSVSPQTDSDLGSGTSQLATDFEHMDLVLDPEEEKAPPLEEAKKRLQLEECEAAARRAILGDTDSEDSGSSSDFDNTQIAMAIEESRKMSGKPSNLPDSEKPGTSSKSAVNTALPAGLLKKAGVKGTLYSDTDSDEELELENLTRRMSKKLESLKKQKNDPEEVGPGKTKANCASVEMDDIKNCPKLSMCTTVNIYKLSSSLLRRLEEGQGSAQVTEVDTDAVNKSRSGPKKFNPIVGPRSRVKDGKAIAAQRLKPANKAANTGNVDPINALFSGSDSGGEDSHQSSVRERVGTLLDTVNFTKDGDDNSGSENEFLIPEAENSEEEAARLAVLGSPDRSGKSEKQQATSKASKPKSKSVRLITPRIVGFTSSDEDEAGSENKSKPQTKKKRDAKNDATKRVKNSGSDSSDSETPKKPKPSYMKDIVADKAGKKKSHKKKTSAEKGKDNESSDDSCLATTQRKKQEQKQTTAEDDSDFEIKITRSRRASRSKKTVKGAGKEKNSGESDDSDTLTPDKVDVVKSDNSDDSDFLPKTKKKVGRNRLGTDSDGDTGEKSSQSEALMSIDDASSDQSSTRKKKPVKKRVRSSSEDSKTKSKKTKRRRRIKAEPMSGSESETIKNDNESDSDIEEITNTQSPSKGRKNIRKVMNDQKLDKTTRQAAKEEDERKRRVAEKQKLFNEAFVVNVDAADTVESLVLDFDKKTKEALLSVDPAIVRQLKPHQVKGIQFMWDTCFESMANPLTGGCILAHCMGLGKTLQAIAFLHTVMANKSVKIRTALVICPLSTVGNWYKEFRMWCKDCDVQPRVHKLWDAKSPQARIHALEDWKRMGGVGIIHYDAFRTLANSDSKKKGKPSKKNLAAIRDALLDPGPDLVICDEGHLLKNPSSQQSKAVMKLTTRRRIVLTGTPLQNNLGEYHTMMSFVKPNLLGTLKEFRNRFVNPIANGQHKDSDEYDVKVMKKRAHVLHKLLDGCVQRLDYSVLTPYLPPKFEYAITINLSEKQQKLYRHYLNNLSGNQQGVEKFVAHKLFADYQSLVKIWTHPIVLTYKNLQKEATTDSETGSLKDFIADSTEEEDSSVVETSEETTDDEIVELDANGSSVSRSARNKKKSTRANPVKVEDDDVVEVAPPENDLGPNWYASFFDGRKDMEKLDLSGKLIVLFEIIKTCEMIGDKVLVFSQFLTSLDLIEDFLEEWDAEERKKNINREVTFPPNNSDSVGRWRPNIEYFRIDGSTKTDDRQKHCDIFNHRQASKAKLFLISTRAGGLGINLTGANRVVIFDASWNPSQDLQSIFRVFRFGQQKPCYVYRLLARATMEEKIYNRQVVKLSLSCRVVDEQQIERHFQFDEIRDMYKFNYDETAERPIPIVPKDRLLADLLISQKDWIFSYLEHDSLLENKEEEELTEEERKAAWEEYNNEGKRDLIPQGLVAGEPWVLSTLPKLKNVHPNKSMAELYQLCLESKRDYVMLQSIFNQGQTTAMDEGTRRMYAMKIEETIKKLKVIFGDTVNWNVHFAEKAKADANARAQQALMQQANRRARMVAPDAQAARGLATSGQAAYQGGGYGVGGQVRAPGWQQAGTSADSQMLYNQLQNQNRAPVSRNYPPIFASPTVQVNQAIRAAAAASARAVPGLSRVQTRPTEYHPPAN